MLHEIKDGKEKVHFQDKLNDIMTNNGDRLHCMFDDMKLLYFFQNGMHLIDNVTKSTESEDL